MPLRFGLFLLLALLWMVPVAGAQEEDVIALSPDEMFILNQINRSRLRENLVHLVPNPILNQIADFYVSDLETRPINGLGDVFLTRDGQNFDTLLTEYGYQRYPEGYVVDFVPLIIRDFNPQQVIDYWYRNYNQTDLRSRRMIREGETLLPVFSPLYREIGIAADFNQVTQRYYYVIVFAAQPNVLPVVVTQLPEISEIVTQVETRDVILYVHDERINRFGSEDIIGGVEYLRISNSEATLACNFDPQLGWRSYENEIALTLPDEPGLQTIYVQMCDDQGRSIISSTQVIYDPGLTATPTVADAFPTPNVEAIANATQTAAASATFYAPYQQTVEAILTATASVATPEP
ncbi:MAG: hypothetical protein K8L99_21325 [Anaerolineae bacterium]|nr:hypothetical protein [Anaerolineae bacterium]